MNPEEPEAKQPIKSLRTYQGDVEEALKKGKGSATTIFVAEQKRKERNLFSFERPTDSGARNKFFIFLGSILFLLGAITIVAVYYVRSTEEVAIIQKTKALISFSTEKPLNATTLNRDQLIDSLVQEKNSFKSAVNSVLYINTLNTAGESLPLESLLSLLAPRMPGALARSFESKYMLGVYSFDTSEFFIILKLNDYPASFAGMLKWEKDMVADIGKLFDITEEMASTTSTFVDESMQNEDLRILKDENKKTILLYSFIDRNTLIITARENILTAIIGKHLINQTGR